MISGWQSLPAQLTERLFVADRSIDSLDKGRLSVDVDNLSFFRDNEYVTTVERGYTLPGFRLRLNATYFPLANMKIEAGVHSIWFWGANRYPSYAYREIPKWEEGNDAKGVHLLPWFRVQLAVSDNFNIVLGDIYGGAEHRLIEPMYNPELNLSSDPEAGIQLLYNNAWLDFDFWTDWMSFVYKDDDHQEAFTVGISSRFKFNAPDSRFHFYMPVQALALHRGGDINARKETVKTIMNGAIGAGLEWNIDCKILKRIGAEFDFFGYAFPKGREANPKSGSGLNASVSAQLRNVFVKTSWWQNKDFMPIFGAPFYGCRSMIFDGMTYDKPSLLHCGVEYLRPFGKGFAMGVTADMFYNFPNGRNSFEIDTDVAVPENIFGQNSNISFGIVIRACPSFLIKRY